MMITQNRVWHGGLIRQKLKWWRGGGDKSEVLLRELTLAAWITSTHTRVIYGLRRRPQANIIRYRVCTPNGITISFIQGATLMKFLSPLIPFSSNSTDHLVISNHLRGFSPARRVGWQHYTITYEVNGHAFLGFAQCILSKANIESKHVKWSIITILLLWI